MDQAPPKGDLKNPFKPRQWKGKDWYYCHKSTGGKCAGAWRVHNPAECKGKAHVFKDSKEPPKKKSKNDARSLKLAKAFVAVAEDDNENTESEHEEDEDSE